ncbi:Uncharacterised protein [Raoultella terrigena]|nr:Uncharacterised protein [Raoultella terrigena]
MMFNWNYMLSLLSDADFWQATWTVIKLSLLTWGCSIVLGFYSRPRQAVAAQAF